MSAKIIQKIHKAINRRSFVEQKKVRARPSVDEFDPLPIKQVLPTIESIATGTPDNVIRQSDAAKVVANLPHLEENRFRIEKLYRHTKIETRQLAVDLLSDEAIAFSRLSGTIEARMQMYKEYAVPLAEGVVKKALLEASAKMDKDPLRSQSIEDAIRLIVFVTSTGFVAPGVDAILIEKLGLRRDVARVTVNFMGCAAAMNGLRVACDHVRANPTHKALVICLELSSVNAAFDDNLNDTIIHSLFSDGCAAVVVGAYEEEQAIAQGKVVIREHLSYLVEGTEDGIVLGIRDNGITCQLSRQLPDYIETGVGPIIKNFLASHELTQENIDLWAVHPGGTRIIEKAQHSLGLSDSQVAHSWEILRQYGNMLSASVLFVMERMLLELEKENLRLNNPNNAEKGSKTGMAFSFSPGVGIEGILFQKFS